MPFPVTINGKTYALADFAPYKYTTSFPAIIQDVSDVAAAAVQAAAAAGYPQAEQALASAATTDIGAVLAARIVITGYATITSFGAQTNRLRFLRFVDGGAVLVPGPTLILPTGVPITTSAGDTAVAASDATGIWRVIAYQRLDGRAVIASTIVAGNSGPNTVPTGSTQYFTHALTAGGASNVYVGPGRQGRFKNLRIITQGAPGAGESWTFTLMKLFSPTALTCTISGSGSNQAADLVNAVDFAANERWSIRIVSSANAAATTSILFSMTFEILD